MREMNIASSNRSKVVPRATIKIEDVNPRPYM